MGAEKVNNSEVTKNKASYEFWKRSLDLASCVPGMLAYGLTYLVLFIPYQFGDNRGPVVFKQKRIGKNGELFEIYKFRSMKVDADKILHEDQQLFQQYVNNGYKLEPKDDPRITRLGAFLRKTSLDELPQFRNVLKGEMSMVGPRPIVEAELKEYEKQNKVSEFTSMKPGITGLWQTNGRSNVGYPERVDLELSYKDNSSIGLDMKVIGKTILKVFLKEGAY